MHRKMTITAVPEKSAQAMGEEEYSLAVTAGFEVLLEAAVMACPNQTVAIQALLQLGAALARSNGVELTAVLAAVVTCHQSAAIQARLLEAVRSIAMRDLKARMEAEAQQAAEQSA